MKAILTKYHGPTNTRGSRITATDGDGNRVSIPYPHHESDNDKHAAAVRALMEKMRWDGQLVGGWTPGGTAWVFLCPSSPRITVDPVKEDR